MDECGVCGGLGTTCALALTLSVDMLTAAGGALPDAGARVSCFPQFDQKATACTLLACYLGYEEYDLACQGPPCAGATLVPHTS